jgi:hypothetical protein
VSHLYCHRGGALPAYYETGSEPVLEIIDCGDLYAIRTESHGGQVGSAVRAGKDRWSKAEMYQNVISPSKKQINSAVPRRLEEGIIDRIFARAAEVLESQENAIT